MDRDIIDFIDDLLGAWNTHDADLVASYYSPDYEGTDVGEARMQQGPDGMRLSYERYIKAFPDIFFKKEDLVVQDNRAALVWVARGTHNGTLMNIPPTGRNVVVRGMSFLTLSKQGITRALYIWDVAGLLREINLLPEL